MNSIIEFTDIVFKPTKFKIFSIMLLIGIAEWTGGGIGQFIYSSELGTIIKCIKTIMNFFGLLWLCFFSGFSEFLPITWTIRKAVSRMNKSIQYYNKA